MELHSIKYLSSEVALYLYKSTIRPCMKHCCHIWADVPSCSLKMLYKLQKRIYMTFGPSVAASFEPLAHHENVAIWSIFFRYYFGRYLSEWAQLVPLPYSRGKPTCYSDRLHNVTSRFIHVTRMSAVSFLARLSSGILSL